MYLPVLYRYRYEYISGTEWCERVKVQASSKVQKCKSAKLQLQAHEFGCQNMRAQLELTDTRNNMYVSINI